MLGAASFIVKLLAQIQAYDFIILPRTELKCLHGLSLYA